MGHAYKPRKNSFFNQHFTSTVSIVLVLFMVGLIAFLLAFANEIAQYTKEHVTLSIVLSDDAAEADVERLERYVSACDFAKRYEYISKEQALQEHIDGLGEDPTELLGYNPLRASIEVYLQADYACADSIEVIRQKLRPFQGIDDFVYQKDMIQLLNHNVNRMAIALSIIALILLFISVALINNTIRISVYSQRFLINTMKLVGARPGFIRKPFMRRAAGNSVLAAVLALAILGGALYYVQNEVGTLLNLYQWRIVLPVVVAVFAVSFVIVMFSTWFAVNRYLRMKTDDLFYV